MFIQKDIYPKIIDNYLQAQQGATKINHYNPFSDVKNMKSTDNLIENSRIKGLKNKPIRNSDKKQAQLIKPPYQKFEGSTALPTFQKDLQAWRLV